MTLSRVIPYRLIEYTSVQGGLPAATHERHFAEDSAGFVYRIVVELEPRTGKRGPFDRLVVPRAVEHVAKQTVDNLERRFAELSAREASPSDRAGLRAPRPDCQQPRRNATTTHGQAPARVAWDAIAAGYDRTNTPSQMWVANEGLRRAELRPGMRFLDVAAGSGALSIPAARLGAQVLATDISPAMLERLEQRARDEGLSVETRVMDGHALELDDDAFDMVGSQFGVMLFPDMPKGIGEMARVLKPGGRVLMNAYGDPRQIEFFGFFVAAIQAVIPSFEGPPMDPLPLPFQLQDPERLRAELATAGLSDIRVETIVERTEFRSGARFWDWLLHSNPIVGAVLAELNLTEEQLRVVQDALDRMVRKRSAGSGPAVLTNPVNIGVATRRTHETHIPNATEEAR